MSGKTIATIYFYVISAASLALIVIGIFSIVNFLINITQYEKYPLRYYPQMDCDEAYRSVARGPFSPSEIPTPLSTMSAEERDKLKKYCEERIELDRKQHKIDDIKGAVTFSLVGLVLFLIHFPLARKQSKS